jgi:hypothetical protein
MTDRSFRRRLWRAERRLLSGLEKRLEIREQRKERVRSLARIHATAVAAIVLSGDPKVDEPLVHAWARALAHYPTEMEGALQYISTLSKLSEENKEKAAAREINRASKFTLKDYGDAAQRIYPVIMNGAKEERTRFTEIFSAAPIWLLTYTLTSIDANLLEFDLPDRSAAPQWGKIGHRGARRWPMLPVGVMTEGDPIAKEEIDPSLSREDCVFALEMCAKPEDEWTRIERRRMLEIGWTPERRRNGTATQR